MMYSNFSTYHPIINLVYFIAIISISMFSMHPAFLAMTFCISFIYSSMLNGIKSVKLNFYFMLPMVILGAVINPLFFHRGVTVLFYLNGNAITLEAIIYGLAAAVMFTSVIIWFSCFNTIMSSDKFIYLFGRIMPQLSLVLSMCLRFVPLFIQQFHEISEGQRAMGRDFSKQSFFKKIRQFSRTISILITWSMENSIETSASMSARGYGLKGRTSFYIYRFDKRDASLLCFIILLVIIVTWGCYFDENNILYYPAIIFNSVTARTVFTLVAYFLLLSLPVIIDIKGDISWKLLSLEM